MSVSSRIGSVWWTREWIGHNKLAVVFQLRFRRDVVNFVLDRDLIVVYKVIATCYIEPGFYCCSLNLEMYCMHESFVLRV